MSIGDEWAGVIAATQHAEELTAPPEGMYWVQVQGLWALRPIAGDLERSVHLSGHRPRASLEPRALSGRLLARRSTLALTTTIMHAWFGPPVDVQGSRMRSRSPDIHSGTTYLELPSSKRSGLRDFFWRTIRAHGLSSIAKDRPPDLSLALLISSKANDDLQGGHGAAL